MAPRKNNLFVPHCIIRDNYYYENSADVDTFRKISIESTRFTIWWM